MATPFLDTILEQSYHDWVDGLQALYGVGAFGHTPEGRPIVWNPMEGGFSTEFTATVQDPRLNDGLWTNIPTIYGGSFMEPDQAIDTLVQLGAGPYDPDTGRRLLGYRTREAAELAARQRTHELDQQVGRRIRRLEEGRLSQKKDWRGQLEESYPLRNPTHSEVEFFRKRPEVAGYAADDKTVVLNPFSVLSDEQKQSVMLNERVRQFIRDENPTFSFTISKHQREFARKNEYGSDESALRATIISRLLSGDSSLGPYTTEQRQAARKLFPDSVKDMQ